MLVGRIFGYYQLSSWLAREEIMQCDNTGENVIGEILVLAYRPQQ